MRIYLTGFMGAGKTTVGRLLSEKLGFPFHDLDSEIEQKENMSVAEIFEKFGEAGFRDLEAKLLRSMLEEPAVISTGGGCFLCNQQWMLDNGKVVYLQVPYKQLIQRIGADPTRPLWRDAETLYQERQAEYLKADFLVDGTEAPERIASRIEELLLKKL